MFVSRLIFCRKKQERQRKRQERDRANSFSDVSSVDSARSSRSPWAKDPTTEAKPITNPVLRKKLVNAKGAKLSATVSFGTAFLRYCFGHFHTALFINRSLEIFCCLFL